VANAPPSLAAFAIAAPGLEPIVAAELGRLGVTPSVEPGGVSWSGTLESVARANLWSRVATRIVVRVAEFRARTFGELERHARKLPWQDFVASGAPVRFRVTSRKSRLYHTDAIAQRLAAAAAERAGVILAEAAASDVSSAGTEDDGDVYEQGRDAGAQLFIIRVVRDSCTVSADSSGALLHRRGYRQAVAKAPLRETLAAAMLFGSEWPGSVPIIDPMCGSGTIPIEAALLARRIAPGIGRTFAFQRWPTSDPLVWERIVGEARERELPALGFPILGSDRDAGAVDAARANAERAGVGSDVQFDRRPISDIEPPIGETVPGARRSGWVVTNPPYGVRVAEAAAVSDLYAAFGNVLRARFGGWKLAMLSPGPRLEGQVGIRLEERFATSNGGIPVRLVTGAVAP
jgi:putative N6-adenine-specific DNA methylase